MSSKSRPDSRAGYMRDYRKGKKSTDTSRAVQIEAEMQQKYEETRRKLEAAMATCEPGTNAYLRHVEAISDLDARHRDERRKCGLDPASLGTGVKPSWHFVCHVSTQGTASVTEIPAENVVQVLAQRARLDAARLAKMNHPGDDEIRRQLNEEFGFNPDGSEKSEE